VTLWKYAVVVAVAAIVAVVVVVEVVPHFWSCQGVEQPARWDLES
jgi:hypothetical protein